MATKKQAEWWKEFVSVINRMPRGTELIVDGDNSVSLYKAGALYDRHLGGEREGWSIEEEALFSHTFKKPIHPYGEGQ